MCVKVHLGSYVKFALNYTERNETKYGKHV